MRSRCMWRASQISTGAHAGIHNTVFIATEHDSLYAFGRGRRGSSCGIAPCLPRASRARTSSLPSRARDTETTDLVPEIGITGTRSSIAAGGYLYAGGKRPGNISRLGPSALGAYPFQDSNRGRRIAASNIYSVTYSARVALYSGRRMIPGRSRTRCFRDGRRQHHSQRAESRLFQRAPADEPARAFAFTTGISI